MSERLRKARTAISAATRTGGASLLLAVIALMVPFGGQSLVSALQYDRDRIGAGEIDRLVSCHWTHFSADHLFWDVATFLILGIACERRGRGRMLATLLLAALVIPLGLLICQPSMHVYRGLSGLDSALFALLCVSVARERSAAWMVLPIAAFFIKTAVELSTHSAIFVDTATAHFTPVPLAHLLGVASGVAGGFFDRISPSQLLRCRVAERSLTNS